MKEIKREYKFFTVADYEDEQEYLRRRHKEGWKFVNITLLGLYTFERCEPEDMVYQLDCNTDRRNHSEEYLQMFRDCGWEYLCDCMGYSYFRKGVSQMKEEEQIFNDDESKLDMLGRVYKGRMIPLLVLFVFCICPQIWLHTIMITPYNVGFLIAYICVLAFYLGIFIKFGRKYQELKRKR